MEPDPHAMVPTTDREVPASTTLSASPKRPSRATKPSQRVLETQRSLGVNHNTARKPITGTSLRSIVARVPCSEPELQDEAHAIWRKTVEVVADMRRELSTMKMLLEILEEARKKSKERAS